MKPQIEVTTETTIDKVNIDIDRKTAEKLMMVLTTVDDKHLNKLFVALCDKEIKAIYSPELDGKPVGIDVIRLKRWKENED